MSQYVLNELGNVLLYQTLCLLTKNERLSNTEKLKIMTFDAKIRSKLGDSQEPPPTSLIYSGAEDNLLDADEQFQ